MILNRNRRFFNLSTSKLGIFNQFIENSSTPRTLVLGQKWAGWHSFRLDNTKPLREALLLLREKIKQQKNLRVIVLLDYPWEEEDRSTGQTDPLRHINRIFPEKSDFTYNISNAVKPWKRANDVVVDVLSDVAEIIDIAQYVCPNNKCDLLKWYKDDNHLRASAIEKWAVWIDKAFE